MLRLSLGEQTLELLPQRGLFWFEQRVLVISDPLFGAGTNFPQSNVPFTGTAKLSTLNRLTTLMNFFEPDLVLILGDLLDPADRENPHLMEGLIFWRQQFPNVQLFRLHDGEASPRSFLADLEMTESTQNHRLGSFEFQPTLGPANGFVIAGRPHPAVKFLDRREGTGIKAPCFHLRSASLCLPAFCSTSPSTTIAPKGGDRVFVIGPNEVVEISPALAIAGDND